MRNIGEVAILALIVTVIATPLVTTTLRRKGISDEPSHRSAHESSMPRGGGVACLIGLLCAIGFAPSLGLNTKFLLLTTALAFASLGFADDVGNISIRVRLVGQATIAVVASAWALHAFAPPVGLGVLACAAGAVWVAAFVNIFNFMDGMNGLAGLAAAIIGVTFTVIGYHEDQMTLAIASAALAGTSLGFLPWNFPHARVFLGDVGSYLLGSWIAVLLLLGWRAKLPSECLIGPVTLFVTDTSWTLARRIGRGEKLTSSHKQHIYQQLHQAGWSHSRVTLFLGTLIAACAALGSLSLTHSLGARLLGDMSVVLLLAGYLASPRLLARAKRSFS